MIKCVCRNITSVEVDELAESLGITGIDALRILLVERDDGCCGMCDNPDGICDSCGSIINLSNRCDCSKGME